MAKATNQNSPRVLIWDIETSHNIVATFQLFNKYAPISHKGIIQERYMICASWKWLGERKVHSVSLLDNAKKFKKDFTDDTHVVETMHKVLSEADAVVAHYGDNFDTKFFNTRVLFHGMKPVQDLIQIDTYKLIKRKFLLNCNKLDYLGQFLGLGGKTHVGLDCWLKVLEGDPKAIAKMVSYNKRDVRLLEDVYKVIAPHVPDSVNRRLFVKNKDDICPRCTSKNFECRGWAYTKARRYRRFQCKDCGGWFKANRTEPL